jgi:hypothetical protein
LKSSSFCAVYLLTYVAPFLRRFCAVFTPFLRRPNDFQTLQLKEGGEAGDHREALQLLQDGVGEQRGDEDVLHAVRMHARHQDGIHRLHQDLEQVPVWIKNYYSVFVQVFVFLIAYKCQVCVFLCLFV